MKKRSVITWMKFLRKEELKEFKKTLKTDSKERKLFTFLCQYYPDFQHPDLDTDDKALDASFKGEARSKRQVADKASDLKLLIEYFIYKKALEARPNERARLLALELNQRQHIAPAIETMKKWQANLEDSTDLIDILERLRLSYEIYFHPGQNKFSKKETKELLTRCRKDLDDSQLILGNILDIEQGQWRLTTGQPPIWEKDNPNPLLPLLEQIRLLFDNKDIANFHPAKQTLLATECPAREHDIITTWLLNFAFHQILNNREPTKRHIRTKWKREVLDLYKYGIDKKALLQNDHLSENHFVNAILLSCELGETDWSLQLAQKGEALLSCANKDFHIQLAFASIDFALKKYIDVHDRLINKRFTTIADNLKARTLLAKTYYEISLLPKLHELKDPVSCLEDLRSYLNNNKDIESAKKKRFTNFIKFTKGLIGAKYKGKKIKELKQKIEASQEEVDNKDWLLEKIEQLAATTR